ncbi:MAG: hypothetical protein LIO93_03115, partial [Bacteroidales bacterium]|nr:hypothetical protein [Bacteroidales bacterium]
LLVWCFILSLGFVHAQELEGTDLPELSTGDDGPWYYIQVIGTDDLRKERVFTVEEIPGDSLKVFSRPISSESFDIIDHQLWRFEPGTDNTSNYTIINKKYPDLYLAQGIWEQRTDKKTSFF